MAQRKRRKQSASQESSQLSFDHEPALPPVLDATLSDEAQRRYLHYALSVITSRALPDVRDGLKPVQRRILFTMHRELHLRSDAKPRKCAAIVGEVMGKFHPHGDAAIYDALVRVAQPWSMRAPLVGGRGNFGSPDGDAPAAMRYTEAKLQKLADELLAELGKKTVHYRPNYDGTRFEPVVLPARFPNLLVNGSQGIAVGMATSIPPHNLGEVVDASVALIDTPDLSIRKLLKHIKGPDFPTGGELLSSKDELEQIYSNGQGSMRLRGEWKLEEPKQGNARIILTSIPYGLERSTIVEKIAEVIIARKLPPLLDVRDESTDDTRIVLEMKKGADPQLIMAYLYKHTPLSTNVQVNLTGLVPTEHPDVSAPSRLNLLQMLQHFLDFRMEVVTKRLQHELDELRKRIHVLEGFEIIFDALDETIRIIRRSKGRKDAAEKLMKRFEIDQEQVDAILELRLYRLAQLEILLIREELKEKRKEAKRIAQLLKSKPARWKLIRAELLELKDAYRDARRTRVRASVQEPSYSAEAFIIEEDAMVVLTQQGWIKRQREVKDVKTTRVREGDRVLEVVGGSTKSSLALYSSFGSCYVCRIVDVPATTGHGVPVQKLFKLADGERIVRAMSFDPRMLEVPPPNEDAEIPEEPHAVAVTRQGMTMCFSLRTHREPSTRAGRKYARLREGDEVLYVDVCGEEDFLGCATAKGHALICSVEEIPVLAGAGKGVRLIKLQPGDEVVGARVLTLVKDALEVEHRSGKKYVVSLRNHQPVSRGGKGHAMFKRGQLAREIPPEPTIPQLD